MALRASYLRRFARALLLPSLACACNSGAPPAREEVVSRAQALSMSTPVALPTSIRPAAIDIAFDGTNYLVSWFESAQIRGARVDTSGRLVDVTPIVLSSRPALGPHRIVHDGSRFVTAYTRLASGQNAVSLDSLEASGPVDMGGGVPAASTLEAAAGGSAVFVSWYNPQTSEDTYIYRAPGLNLRSAAPAGSKVVRYGDAFLVAWAAPAAQRTVARTKANGTLDTPTLVAIPNPGQILDWGMLSAGPEGVLLYQGYPRYGFGWFDGSSWTYHYDGPTAFLNLRHIAPIRGSHALLLFLTTSSGEPVATVWRAPEFKEVKPAFSVTGGSALEIKALSGASTQALVAWSTAVGDGGTAGSLRARIVNLGGASGAACATADDCADGRCVDGRCCESACDGVCQTCAGSQPGRCTPLLDAEDPGTCAGANACDARGACKVRKGEACTDAAQCASGFCVEGSCCTQACQEGCATCAGTRGECMPLASGTMGRGARCAGSVCDGNDTRCPAERPLACLADTLAELPTGAPRDCAPFRCRDGDCVARCTTVYDCVTGAVCNPDGQCIPPTIPRGASSGCAIGAPAGCRDSWQVLVLLYAALAFAWRAARSFTRVRCLR